MLTRMLSARSLATVGFAALALAACKSKPPTPQPKVDLVRAAADLKAAQAFDHGRAPFSPKWSTLADSPSDEARAAVALGLGRSPDVLGLPTLWKLLGDGSPAVRRSAAFALGAFETRLKPGGDGRDTRNKMLERLFEETDGGVIAALVLALGRVGGETAELVLDRALVHPLVEVREAGALGLGRLAGVSLFSARKLLAALPPLFAKEKEKSVRQAAAFSLSRIGTTFPALLADADPLVRFFAWQGAAKEPTTRFRGAARTDLPFDRGLADPDVNVRVAALNAAASHGELALLAKGLAAAWKAATATPASLTGALIQPVMAGLTAANKAGAAMPEALRKLLSDIHAQSQVKNPAERTPQALASLDAVQCAAASALDIAAGAPKLVLQCGEPRVPDWQRKRLAGKLLSHVRGGTTEARLAALAPLVRDLDPRVRSATGDALALVWNAPGVRGLVLGALKTRDAAVLGALFDAIAQKGGRDPEMEAAILETAPALRSGRDADVMVSLAEALGALGSPKAAPVLMALAQDPVRAVREAARKTVQRIYPSDPTPPRRTAGMSEHPAPVDPNGPDLVARLRTSQGSFDVRLLRHLAPLTVGNFVALVRKGFYKGLLVHRVVPAFVAQMGDPRGDGSGGPGYVIPCELTPTRFRRGSVGMALSGRDTGGSQFFITHTDTPHLDGAYPLFAEVIQGMEVVDALVEGDVLQDITLISE